MDGAAPPRPGAVAAAPWDPPWDASLLTKGFGAPLPPGPPRLAFVPPFAAGGLLLGRIRGSEPLHLGVSVPPSRAAHLGLAVTSAGW